MSDEPNATPETPPVPGRSIADPVAVSLNAAGEVAAPEAICLRCGYTIHGLPGTGACPECGTPIADSLRGRLLRFSDRSYVQSLHRGVVFLLVGLVLAFSAQFIGAIGGAGIGVFGVLSARGGAAPAPIVTVTPRNPTTPATPDGSLPPDAAIAPAIEVDVIPPPAAAGGAEPNSASDPASPDDEPVLPEIDTATDAGAATAPPGGTAGKVRVTRQAGGMTITSGGGAGGGGAGGLPSLLQTLITVFSFVAAGFEVLVLLGWWWFSSPDPALPEGERGDGPRRVIRVVVVLVAISTFVGLGLTQAGMTGLTPSFGLFGLIGFTALAELSKIARFFASMLYLRWLSPRLPDELVDRRSRLYIWLLPVIYVVGSCLIVGPLVAAVMQWILLLRVKNDLKQILDDMPVPDDSGGIAPFPGP